MTFEDLLKLLDEYPDAFVMIDSKQYSVRNYQRTLEDYAQYREISIKAGIEHTLKQIIPEIYNSTMYPGTALLYKFPAYIYSLWQEYTTEELNDIAEFCQTNKIMAVTIYRDYWSEEVQKIFDERDILVYIYTINDKEEARRYLANGAQGVCTDVLIDHRRNALLFLKVPYAPVLEEVSPAACILFQASRTYPVPDGDMEEGESSSHLAM